MHDDVRSLLPKMDFTRREFTVTTLAAGFALAVQPVSAQTITTDTNGLEAGEVKIPVARRDDSRVPGDAGRGRTVPGRPRRPGDLRRSRAHQGHLPPARQARLPGGRARAVCPARRRVEDREHPGDHLQGRLQGARRPGHVRPRRDRGLGQGARARATPRGSASPAICWGGRIVWLYAAHNPNLKAGVAWYGRLVGQPDELHPKNPIDLAESLKAPVLGLYGAADTGIPVDTVEKMRTALKEANKPAEIVLYPDTPHAFYRRLPAHLPQGARRRRLEAHARVVQEERRGLINVR